MDTTTGPKTHHATAKVVLRAILALTVVALFFSCGRGSDGHPQTDSRRQKLHQLDSLISVLAPEARTVAEQGMATSADSLTYYEYFVRLAKYFSTSETPDSTAPYVERTLRFAAKQKPSPRLNSLQADAYLVQANVLHNFHQAPDTVVERYKQCCQLLANSDNQRALPPVCANLADAYVALNDLPTAAHWYRRALFLVDSLSLPERENVTLYMGLAQIYLGLRDYDATLTYYKKVEPFYNDLPPSMKAYYLNNYGNFYYYTRDFPKALQAFQHLAKMLQEQGMQNKFDMYLCKVNLADVWLNLGNTAQARRYLDEVEPFFSRKADGVALYYCRTIRIGIAIKEGDSATVERLLAAHEDTETIPFNLVNVRRHYLSRHYERTGDYRRAYTNLQQGILYDDSLEHNISNMRSAEIMARFEQDTLQLHHQIMMEHKNATLAASKTTATLAIAAVIILALLMALWLLYVLRQRALTDMSLMQLKLTAARNRISPHFVFNVLNNKILSSTHREADELQHLTRLIRANLDLSAKPCVTLAEELDFVSKYVEVERYLLGDDFEFLTHIAADVDLEHTFIPSMLLQILAENSVIHGLKNLPGRKLLQISASRQPAATVVTLEDNGPGFNVQNVYRDKRTGLTIISQTVAVVNQRNKRKMQFSIHNKGTEGHITGCIATIIIPDNIKFV